MRRSEAIGTKVTATGTRTYFGCAAELVRIAHVESSEQRAVLGVVRNLSIVNFAIVVGMVALRPQRSAMSAPRIIPLVLTALLAGGAGGTCTGDVHARRHPGRQDAGAAKACC